MTVLRPIGTRFVYIGEANSWFRGTHFVRIVYEVIDHVDVSAYYPHIKVAEAVRAIEIDHYYPKDFAIIPAATETGYRVLPIGDDIPQWVRERVGE